MKFIKIPSIFLLLCTIIFTTTVEAKKEKVKTECGWIEPNQLCNGVFYPDNEKLRELVKNKENYSDSKINTYFVTSLRYLFANDNNPIHSISNWNTSNVVDMSFLFYKNKDFNQDISSWKTSKVINMDSMFNETGKFNQPLNSWNVSNLILPIAKARGFYNCLPIFRLPLLEANLISKLKNI